MRGVVRSVAIASVLGVSALSCSRWSAPKAPPGIPAPVPGGDELYVFPHGRLSLSAFETLKREYPSLSPRDLARLSMITLWLPSRLVPGARADPPETARSVRAIFLPAVSESDRKSASSFLRSRFGISSLDGLRRDFTDAARGWVVEWNPSLAREAGISR